MAAAPSLRHAAGPPPGRAAAAESGAAEDDDATTAELIAAMASSHASGSGDITMRQLRLLVNCFTLPSERPSPLGSPAGRSPVQRELDATGHRSFASVSKQRQRGEHDADDDISIGGFHVPPPHLLRTLSREEFIDSVSGVLSQFPRTEIEQWFGRIDADDQQLVTWGDFSTFLLSRAQYQQQADSRGAEYGTTCQPSTPPPLSQCHGEGISVIIGNRRANRVYTGARDGTVRFWAADTMEHVKIALNTESWVSSMCLTRNDTRLVVASVDRTVTTIDARSGDVVRTYEGRMLHGHRAVKYANRTTEPVERKIVAAVRNDRSVLGLDPAVVKLPHVVGGGGGATPGRQAHTESYKKLDLGILVGMTDVPLSIASLGNVGNEDRVAFACRDGSLRAYDLPWIMRRVTQPAFVYRPHGKSAINQVEYSSYLNGLVTCSDDHTLCMTDVEGHEMRRFVEGGHQRPITGFAWSDGIKVLASSSSERSVLIWDRMAPAPVNHFSALSAPVTHVCLNDNAHQLVVTTLDNTIRIFDLRTNTQLQALAEHDVPREHGAFSSVSMLGSRIVCGSNYPVAYLTRRELGSGSLHEYCGHLQPAALFAYNKTSDQLISIDGETAYTWNVDDGSPVFLFGITSFRKNLLDEMRLTAIAVDSSCRRVVTGFHRGIVVIWNVSNGQPIAQLHDERFIGHTVTAVLTAVRQGHTFYIVALGLRVVVCETTSDKYSISVRAVCDLPSICGRVVTMTQVSSNGIACGTAAAAVIFLNLLTMYVEGEPLLPPLGSNALHRRMSSMLLRAGQSARGNVFGSSDDAATEGTDQEVAAKDPIRAAGLRCEHISMLEGFAAEPHALACYTNGQVILWNTRWRTASHVTYVSTIAGYPTVFTLEYTVSGDGSQLDLLLAYGDDMGFVYACRGRATSAAVCPSDANAAVAPSRDSPPVTPLPDEPVDVTVAFAPATLVVESAHGPAIATLSLFHRAPPPANSPPPPDSTEDDPAEGAEAAAVGLNLDPSVPVRIYAAVSYAHQNEAKLLHLCIPEWAGASGAAACFSSSSLPHACGGDLDASVRVGADAMALEVGVWGGERWSSLRAGEQADGGGFGRGGEVRRRSNARSPTTGDDDATAATTAAETLRQKKALVVHYDSVDFISDVLMPQAGTSAAGSMNPSVADRRKGSIGAAILSPAKDPKTIADLVALLNARSDSAEETADAEAAKAPPPMAETVTPRGSPMRRRGGDDPLSASEAEARYKQTTSHARALLDEASPLRPGTSDAAFRPKPKPIDLSRLLPSSEFGSSACDVTDWTGAPLHFGTQSSSDLTPRAPRTANFAPPRTARSRQRQATSTPGGETFPSPPHTAAPSSTARSTAARHAPGIVKPPARSPRLRSVVVADFESFDGSSSEDEEVDGSRTTTPGRRTGPTVTMSPGAAGNAAVALRLDHVAGGTPTASAAASPSASTTQRAASGSLGVTLLPQLSATLRTPRASAVGVTPRHSTIPVRASPTYRNSARHAGATSTLTESSAAASPTASPRSATVASFSSEPHGGEPAPPTKRQTASSSEDEHLTAVERLVRERERRLQRHTVGHGQPLHRRVRQAEERLRIGDGHAALGAQVAKEAAPLNWTVRATAKLPPQGIGDYNNADTLVTVLRYDNPAMAARATGTFGRTTILGRLVPTSRELLRDSARHGMPQPGPHGSDAPATAAHQDGEEDVHGASRSDFDSSTRAQSRMTDAGDVSYAVTPHTASL